ncbi:hypothetical protein AJ79_02698 [Helicocarpus griseus UAMH5409]|uniref:Aminoglycoside phosphotransferase domain-containing protein n=1 Tax=Helicocarpus griseus UAMH5409 TaxID=1447875 RepID=A0A2B7Y0M5_9EURO|nr:hypothetical protein AJ79_02698 [Helicocarpus griseus UAMH5409]
MDSEAETPLDERAVNAIYSTHLSALDHDMLISFLINSVSTDEAAQYVLDFSRDDPLVNPDTDTALRERDANRCCVSGVRDDLKATYIVSPSVKEDKDLRPGGSLRGLLEAAITKELASQLFSYLESSSGVDSLKNLWLMSLSVRENFVNGHIYMEGGESATDRQFLNEEDVPELHTNFHKQPTSPDNQRLPLPEPFLLRIHRVVSIPLHFIPIGEKVSRGWPLIKKKGFELGLFGRFLFRGFFLLIPNFLHLAIYRLILRASLPFGLCLKFGRRVPENEANALRVVEKSTNINAPRLINFTKEDKTGYLLMTKVPGVPLGSVIWRMTYEERRQLAKDLGKCISQLRSIPNKNKNALCDTTGGPLTDHRLDEDLDPWGPYNSKTEFLDEVTAGLEDQRGQPPLSYLYEKDHDICFTHSDLSLSNLFVERGRLTGIIDWEHAGYKPEYWEYTRAVWTI